MNKFRRARSTPSPRTRINNDEATARNEEESSSSAAGDNDKPLELDTAALWTTAVEVIRGVSNLIPEDEDTEEEGKQQRDQGDVQQYDAEEETYAQGMRNLLLSLEKNFESEITEKTSNKTTGTPFTHDQVVSVLQKSLSLSKKKKKARNYFKRSQGRASSTDFYSKLPDIDEDMSLHVTPSLEDFAAPLTDTSTDSQSSAEQRDPKSPSKSKSKDARLHRPQDAPPSSPWKRQVRVQSQLPNVEVLLLRRASSLQRSAGSLKSANSLGTNSIRSNGSTMDGSVYYSDDEYDDDSSAFTRLRSYSSMQTSTSNVSYAFQEADEEDDILPDCHSFSWFGPK